MRVSFSDWNPVPVEGILFGMVARVLAGNYPVVPFGHRLFSLWRSVSARSYVVKWVANYFTHGGTSVFGSFFETYFFPVLSSA
jgi:hypothetical protein